MPRKYADNFLIDMKCAIEGGSTLAELARKHGFSPSRVSKELKDRFGFTIPAMDKLSFIRSSSSEIISAYNRGESVLAISQRYDCSRTFISKILKDHGVVLRDGSKAMRVRMSSMTRDERIALSAAARSTRLANLGINARNEIKSAAIGLGENEIFQLLNARGFNPTRQVIVERYPIDIVFRNVAVEVKFKSIGFSSTRGNGGDKKIIESGYILVYFVINSPLAISTAADEVVALLDFTSRNPPSHGEYWMIRCCLDDMSAYDQINHRSLVEGAPQVTTSISKRKLC